MHKKFSTFRIQDSDGDGTATTAMEMDVQATDELTQSHPLLNDLILECISSYINPSDLANSRLLCRQFNEAVSKVARKKLWLSLKTKPGHISNFLRTKTFENVHCSPFEKTRLRFHNYLIPSELLEFMKIYARYIKTWHLYFDRYTSMSTIDHYEKLANEGGFKTFLQLDELQQCEVLMLTNLPYLNMVDFGNIFIRPHLSIQEIKINHTCSFIGDPVNYFGNDSYYAKLLKACPSLKTLNFSINLECSIADTDIEILMGNLLRIIRAAYLKNLSDLSLSLYCRTAPVGMILIDLAELGDLTESPHFNLRSLRLHNLLQVLQLFAFLEHHQNTLEELRISFDNPISSIDIGMSFIHVPFLPNLKILEIPTTHSNVYAIMTGSRYPQLEKVKIPHLNTYGDISFAAEYPQNGSINCLKLEMSSRIKCISKTCDTYLHTILSRFPNVVKLSLVHLNERRYFKALANSLIQYTLTSLSLSENDWQEAKNRLYPGCVAIHFDARITGYSSSNCAQLLDRIKQSEYNLVKLDVQELSEWSKICKYKQEPSNITRFPNLRKLKLTFFPKSGMTEVSVMFILLSLKKLATLVFRGTEFDEKFVNKIRSIIPLPLYLDLKSKC